MVTSILLPVGDVFTLLLLPVVQAARQAARLPDPSAHAPWDRLQPMLVAGFHAVVFSAAILGVVWFGVKLPATLGRIASRIASSAFRR